MNDIKILLVDDEQRMRKLVSDFLKKQGYIVYEASDGKQALEIFDRKQKELNLIILDVMMPFIDGWDVLRKIRETSQVPVIMLTARSAEEDELKGFDTGADEYISKPFSPMILVARVQALLKRTSKIINKKKTFEGLEIDEDAHTVKVDDKYVELTPKEFELLVYLTDNEGIALSREKILNSVWDYDYMGDERTVDTHIKKLRVKLEKRGDYIQTVRGLGYKFEVSK